MTDQQALPHPRVTGTVVGVALVAAATVALLIVRDHVTTASPALVLVLPGVVAAAIGDRVSALVAAVTATAAFGYFFLPPFDSFRVLDAADILAIALFVIVALALGELTTRETEGRRTAEAQVDELEDLPDTLAAAEVERARMRTELDKMADLTIVDHQRTALLRSVSHDLRTPLATIRAVASDLRGDTPYDDETRRNLIGLVGDEAERLDRLVANLLSMSRVEAGAFAPERQAVDLPELLATSIKRVRRPLHDRRVELDAPDDLPLVDVDYTQVDQVVTNLLENASRHSPPRSIVRVTARPDGDWVKVAVEDSGAGVLPTERTRVFEAFHHSDGSRSTGIGLAICKAVVEAHGGAIRVTDAAGGGARFVFTLPVHHATSLGRP